MGNALVSPVSEYNVSSISAALLEFTVESSAAERGAWGGTCIVEGDDIPSRLPAFGDGAEMAAVLGRE